MDAAPRRDRQAGDRQAAEEGEQIAREGHPVRHRPAECQVDQREGADGEEEGERVGGSVAHHQPEVPQAITQDRPAEGDGNRRERQHGEGREAFGKLHSGDVGEGVEGEERRVSRGHADQNPEQLPTLLPVLHPGQAGREHGDRRGGEQSQVAELEPVEQRQRAGRRRPEEQAALGHRQVDLQHREAQCRQVEQRQQPARPRRVGARNGEEEVERQWRQRQAGELVGQVDPDAGAVDREDGREEIENGGSQAPDVEEHAARSPPEGEQADGQIADAERREDQPGEIEIERRSQVADGLEAVATGHDELGFGLPAELATQVVDARRLGAVDQEDPVPGGQRDGPGCVDPTDPPVIFGCHRLEAERLEAGELAPERFRPEHAEGASEQEEQKDGAAPRGVLRFEGQQSLRATARQSRIRAVIQPREAPRNACF